MTEYTFDYPELDSKGQFCEVESVTLVDVTSDGVSDSTVLTGPTDTNSDNCVF